MDEADIKYLISNNRWITVQPSKLGVWKAIIYKRYKTKAKKNEWKVEYSTKCNNAKKCYDWIESMFYDLKDLKDIK